MFFRAVPPSMFAFVFLAIGCASSETTPPAPSAGDASPGDASATTPAPPASTCKSPRTGRYLVDVVPKTSCAWWDSTDDSADMNILEDAVRYPHTDDVCGDVQWNGCTLTDECGPIKFDAGSQGWIGKGSLSITFTDDEHFTGTVTYDTGHPCVMTLEIRGERLNLGG
jgi:hypothetical protein